MERYTIPKSDKLIGNLQEGGKPINLNFNFGTLNSPRSPLFQNGFKKK